MLQIQTSRPLLVLEIREKLSRHAGERIVHFKARNSLRHPPELLTLPTSSLAAQINCLHLQSNYYSFTKGAESHCLLPVKYLCSRCQYTQSCAAGCAGAELPRHSMERCYRKAHKYRGPSSSHSLRSRPSL
jgi:hypothetical protein